MFRRVFGVVVLGSGILLSGCSSEIAAPEGADAPEAADAAAPPPPKAAHEVALSLPGRVVGPVEVELWEKAFRDEARRSKAVVSVDREPEYAKDAPGRQAAGIREAAKRGATLIVVPAPEIQAALDEAAKLGAPILALDGPLSAGGKPVPIVTFPPPEETARALVEAVSAASKAAGFPPEGPALILHRESNDRRALARAEALEAALRAAKIEVLPRLIYDGGAIEAKKALVPALKDHPKVALAFSTEQFALPALLEQRTARITAERFAIGGYTDDRKELLAVSFGQIAALVDLNLARAVPIALQVALELADGKAVPDRTIVPQPLAKSSGADLTDQLPKVPPIPSEHPVPRKREVPKPPPGAPLPNSNPVLMPIKKDAPAP